MTGIVFIYTKYVFRAPLVTGIVVKYTTHVFTALKYVFTALCLYGTLICLYGTLPRRPGQCFRVCMGLSNTAELCPNFQKPVFFTFVKKNYSNLETNL